MLTLKLMPSMDLAEFNERLEDSRPNKPPLQPELVRYVNICSFPVSINATKNIDSKVNGLFRDGLKLLDASDDSMERKGLPEGSNKPGVIVVPLISTN